ncbi:MAG TPA: endonuclease III [Polyangia bacterium]|nr:endonuclease III [Polyangia bacterium]
MPVHAGKLVLLKASTPARARSPRPRLVTKATRRPRRGPWPPDPARVRSILEGLEELYPDVDCELDRETPFQLVCATILSAQCTDDRVNMVTPALFKAYPTPAALAKAPLPKLEALIRSTGFFRAKARSLKGMATMLVKDFGGEVPRTLAALVRLPGVARKTAGVVLGTAFGLAENVVVDTHVQRLAMRLGLTRSPDVKNIEQDLMKVIPQESWIRFSHQIIWHGRRVCFARKPRCETCTLAPFCPSAGLET